MSLIITRNFKRANALDAAAKDRAPDGWWEGKTIFAAFGWGKSVKGKVVSHKGGVIKLEDGTQFKESDAYDLYAIDSSASDAAEFHVGQRVRAKDPSYEYSEGKSLGAGMFTVKEVNNNGDVKLDDYGDLWISPSALVEANDACGKGEDAEKFRVGQKVRHTRFGTIGKVFEIEPDGGIGVQWSNGQAYYGEFRRPLSEIVAVN